MEVRKRIGIPTDVGTVVLFGLDVTVIGVVIGAGLYTHGANPFGEPMYFLQTAAPFVFGWCVGGTLMGVYSGRMFQRAAAAVGSTIAGWILAVLIGGAIRASFLPGGAPPIFLAVLLATGLAGLLPVRLAGVGLSKMNS